MIPAVDIAYIASELEQLAEELMVADDDDEANLPTAPRSLIGTTGELLDKLRRITSPYPGDVLQPADAHAGDRNLTALGNHGIDLIAQIAALAGRLRKPQLARRIEGLALPLACWVSRQGGEVNVLNPVVNGAAALANSLRQPPLLAQLYALLRDICAAVGPQVSQETVSSDPTRPWRVFLLNQAIVATRSHQPALMEEAFELLTEHLPDDAPDFFRDGMEQMDALAYPPQVRAVMEHYYSQWCGRRTLH